MIPRVPAWGWVLVGIALRLAWPEGFLFRQDEAEHLEFSQRISQQGEWLRHAWPSSVGVENGPVFAYFLAFATFLSLDPRVAFLLVVAANGVALAFAVPLFRSVLASESDARAAIALYATNPVAIWFSRKIWDPCVLALFAVPALVALARVLGRDRSRAVFFVPPLVALAAQVHQSGVFFAVVAVGLLASRARALALPWLAGGTALGAVIAFPYGSFLVGRLADGVEVGSRSRWPDVDVLTNLVLDASGHNILQAANREAGAMLLWPLPPLWLLVQLAAIPLAIYLLRGYGLLFRRNLGTGIGSSGVRPSGVQPSGVQPSEVSRSGVRTPVFRPRMGRLLAGFGIGLPALYLVLLVRGVSHYFLAILPLLLVLTVAGAGGVRRESGWRRLLLPLPALVGVNVLSWLGFQSYMSAHWGSESYGLPYGRVAQVCTEGVEALEAKPRLSAEGAGSGVGAAPPGGSAGPIRVFVDVPRDRGPLPAQYRYVWKYRLGHDVAPAATPQEADLLVRIRWPKRGRLREPPYEIRP